MYCRNAKGEVREHLSFLFIKNPTADKVFGKTKEENLCFFLLTLPREIDIRQER